ncbi:hypothetical protein F0562_019250 [Nyssa sinensis]|uniref:Receptor-like serine/threonine-protein kinase n=1 Tax=Nyssa sinensis TaxID=561372 RepID=A0A5J4ZFG1_9ASTE|nr:hypothetical protein F0562_019250 [Nyssa sinensis]
MSPIVALFASLLIISVTFGFDATSNAATTMAKPIRRSPGSILKTGKRLESSSVVIISGNATIQSENGTFELGFFSTNDESRWYLGIWYASIPTPIYVWVANRITPVKNLASAKLEVTADGRLTVKDSGDENIWQTENTEKAVQAKLLDEGNLVLLTDDGKVVWQSFDYPTDTWLPGMNLTTRQWLSSWRSLDDPSPGRYSLRLKAPEYGEIELVFGGIETYWSTGNWTGNAFTGVPQMMIPYIYRFHFANPFTPAASFWYTETSLESGTRPPLTRFQVDFFGRLRQFTWSPQAENWNIFWSQPENLCRVYGLCGNFGFCNTRNMWNPCNCLAGFRPVDEAEWDAGDFSGGCTRESDALCGSNDAFEDVGAVSFDGAVTESFSGSRNITIGDILYVRVQRRGETKKNKNKTLALIISTVSSFMAISTLIVTALLFVRKSRIERRKKEEEAVFPVTNLKVFSYKELNAATRGFSEKLGHGGFGAVFRGQLGDSSLVAVKRLERPGGGEREFRAEVCTIGNIQHVNLVRLRGFCSENSHRLLVYDYMPNGPLSAYLRQDSQSLSWEVRFRVATGMARGIAYLHEECRDCIIHCDIKPDNILLDEDFSAKVSDFGLAKLIGRDFSRVLATTRGTWGYVAPEWISGVAITAKADVYSFGMTLLELLGGRRNVEGPPSAGEGGTGEKWFFPPWAAHQIIGGNVAAVVDEKLGGMYNAVEAERVGLVAVWCIQDDEAMRPTMGMVVKMLEGVVEVTVPPPPKLLQALVSGESFHGIGADSSNRVSSSDGGCLNDNIQLSVDSKDS